MNNYNAENIEVLNGTDAIRKIPAMYIGSTSSNGLHQLFFEVIDNAIDEFHAGFAKEIQIILKKNGECCIFDNGRGIPTDIHRQTGLPACQIVFTMLHSGGKFNNDSYSNSMGLHGVGLSCVNALSRELDVKIYKNKKCFNQKFSKGKLTQKLIEIENTDNIVSGTNISFLPDFDIFSEGSSFSLEIIKNRMRELAFLSPGIKISIVDENSKNNITYQFKGGIKEYLQYLLKGKKLYNPNPIYFSNILTKQLSYELTFQWTRSYGDHTHSYVNGVSTIYGGTHIDGVKQGITKTIREYALKNGLIEKEHIENISISDVFEGLELILSLKMHNPIFEGQTKTKLNNTNISQRLEESINTDFYKILKNDSKLGSAIIQKILDTFYARVAARKASDRAYSIHFNEKGIDEEVYKKQFGERSKNWHESAVWITNDELLAKHVEHTDVKSDSIALDVCCGSGVVGASFKHKVKKVIGLDLTPEMVALAKTRLDEVHQGNVYNLPFDDNSFDLVVTREVLHLLPRPELPTSEMFRVLKPGGQFIVGQILPFNEIDAPWMYRVFKKKQPLIYNMFQEEDFRNLLLKTGFIDLKMTEYNLWESIDVWIDTVETSGLHRHEIRNLFYNASKEVKENHPFKILPSGEIMDLWRWCIFSVQKPS